MTELRRRQAVRMLASTCEAIANGQFENMDILSAIVTDEHVPLDIRELAEMFAGMAVQIELREFHSTQLIDELTETRRQLEAARNRLVDENKDLRGRLKKLEVQYDKEQAQQEIQEIADTDYFRELQTRARTLRERYTRKN